MSNMSDYDSPFPCAGGPVCYIIPPYILEAIRNISEDDSDIRDSAQETLNKSTAVFEHRETVTSNIQGLSTTQDDSTQDESRRPAISSIIPDQLLSSMAESADVDSGMREGAQRTLQVSQQLRASRIDGGHHEEDLAKMHLWREIYDSHHTWDFNLLPLELKRAEGEPMAMSSRDPSIDLCYKNLGRTFEFLTKVLGRNSINGRGMSLVGNIHFGKMYGNAVWDGKQMIFGDGDGKFLGNFTNSLDVIAHELGHGVTQYTANLNYRGQSGALNESMSDVLGAMVKQYSAEPQETAAEADWLIGEECLFPGVAGVALRSMKEPGTAYNQKGIGKDPQVAHMKDYVKLKETQEEDWGGVHYNSGIPNKAFYLVATELGGHSWEVAGKIWYHTLLDGRMKPDCDFKTFADLTCVVARSEYSKKVEAVVRKAWVDVGVYEEKTPFPVDKSPHPLQ